MKKDCFAYGGVTKCLILAKLKCEGCAFYKTKEQLKIERQEAKNRLLSLSLEKQSYIKDKYGNSKFD